MSELVRIALVAGVLGFLGGLFVVGPWWLRRREALAERRRRGAMRRIRYIARRRRAERRG